MKDAKTAAVSRKQLMPLIRYAAGPHGYGFVIAIKRELDRRTGKTWRRENVARWLDADPETWTQPLHGAGLMVREIGLALIDQREAARKSKCVPRKAKSDYKRRVRFALQAARKATNLAP